MKIVVVLQAALLAALGIILVLFGLLIGMEQQPSEWIRVGGMLLESAGIAFIGFAVFGVLVDSKNWREYFGQRLREVVLEQTYLERLGDETLKSLQTQVMKALFRDPEIDREGSFLNYFNTNLHGFITEPYREDVTCTMTVEEVTEEGYWICDRVLYTCRRAGEAIQPTVKWSPDPDEFLQVRSILVEVQFPQYHERRGEWETIYDREDLVTEDLSTFSVECDLSAYSDVDGLIVKIEAYELVRAARMQMWQMAHPTRNFEFTLSVPDGYTPIVKPLVLNEDLCHIAESKGLVTVRYDSWMLPSSGMGWQILEEKEEV